MHLQVSLKLEISASASLKDLEQGIQEAGQQAMREALGQAIRQREDQQVACPCCGHTQRRLEGTVGRVVATVFGRVSLPRRRFRCQNCWQRWCPANGLFVGLAGTTISEPLQDAARLAGSSWPYRVASQLLQKLSGAQISAEEIRLLTNKRGKQRAGEQHAEAERLTSCQQISTEESGKPPVLVGLDGGWVCSREQRGGMEGKVAVVCSQVQDLPMPSYSTTFSWSERGGPRRPPRQRHRLATRRYVATFAPSEHLGTLAQAASQRIVDDPSRPVVVIADGAHWIRKAASPVFPASHLYPGLGASLARNSSCGQRGRTCQRAQPARTRLSDVSASHLALAREASITPYRPCGHWPQDCLQSHWRQSRKPSPIWRTSAAGLARMSSGAHKAIPWAVV
jgi:hypothetical protein